MGTVAELGNNVATLFELQAKLAEIDARECSSKAVWPLVAVMGSAAVALSALTVGMFGIAELLAALLNLRPGWAMLLTSALALAITGGILYVSSLELKQSFHVFRRSREELVRNLNWVRTVLLYSGRSVPKRG